MLIEAGLPGFGMAMTVAAFQMAGMVAEERDMLKVSARYWSPIGPR